MNNDSEDAEEEYTYEQYLELWQGMFGDSEEGSVSWSGKNPHTEPIKKLDKKTFKADLKEYTALMAEYETLVNDAGTYDDKEKHARLIQLKSETDGYEGRLLI